MDKSFDKAITFKDIGFDRDLFLFFINTFLVIFGYGLAVATEKASVTPMLYIKQAFLFYSIFVLIKGSRLKLSKSIGTVWKFIFVYMGFSVLIVYNLLSIKTFFSFFVPVIYVFFIIYKLKYYYGHYFTLMSMHYFYFIIYLIPIISFFIYGGDLSATNIYGEQENSVFISNHYGWSSALVILSALSLMSNTKQKLLFKILILIGTASSIFLLIISASRSSWVSVFLAMVFLMFQKKAFSFPVKILIILSIAVVFTWISQQEFSAFQFVLEKTTSQYEEGNEARFIATGAIVDYYNENPEYWITGSGMFEYSFLRDLDLRLNKYHNSYWEVLFGGGIIIFILFLIKMVIQPFYIWFKNYSSYSLLIFPILIIPFFESNLTGGQFLFYPWFSYIAAITIKTPNRIILNKK